MDEYVVMGGCVGCRHSDCLAVCPIDAFRVGANAVVIDPDLCIGCGACEPECPEDAIREIHDVPAHAAMWIDINSVLSGRKSAEAVDTSAWPVNLRAAVLRPDFRPWPVASRLRALATIRRGADIDPAPADEADYRV